MNFYQQDNADKLTCINRCYFDAEHGWITLALDRLKDLHRNFPADSQVLYAEGLIRKDYLGQGIIAEECFLKACICSKNKSKTNENYHFSSFNSAKYARDIDEYRRQEKIVREMFSNDPDIAVFDLRNRLLSVGASYSSFFDNEIGPLQKGKQHGECAAMAELALYAGDFILSDEISLRNARMIALRELDKSASDSRTARGEGFPPEERLALLEAIKELEQVIVLDPGDHTLWNYKSAWLYLLDQYEESIISAEKALSLCPGGYIRPYTNKSMALAKIGRAAEAAEYARKTLKGADSLGSDGILDYQTAERLLNGLSAPQPSDEELLRILANKICKAVVLTYKQEVDQDRGVADEKAIFKGLTRHISRFGKGWNPNYIKIMAEFLTIYCPETVFATVLQLPIIANRHEEYYHCLNAVLYIAAHGSGAVQRDACRFLLFTFVGAREPTIIRKDYREAILGSTAVGPGNFSQLESHMRNEISRYNPLLLKLIADQDELSDAELSVYRNITMARFIDGVSRDPFPIRACKKGILDRFFDWRRG